MNLDELFAQLQFDAGDWESRALELLKKFDAEGINVLAAANLAADFDQRLRQGGNEQRALHWRSVMAPRILQLEFGKSFNDLQLIVLAAAISPTMAEESEWAAAVRWLNSWQAYDLAWAAKHEPIHVLQVRQVLASSTFAYPPIFHPLILSGLRRLLTVADYASVALPLCRWLVDNVFVKPRAEVTVETAFAAGPVILDLAQHHGVDITTDLAHSPDEWAQLTNRVIQSIVDNSTGASNLGTPWQDKTAQVHELFERCTYWQAKTLTQVLRTRAGASLQDKVNELDTELAKADISLNADWFSPGFESAGHVPLPDRRGRLAFWQDSRWNNKDGDEYTALLAALQTRATNVDTSTSQVRDSARTLQDKRVAYQEKFKSPLAKAALPEIVATPSNDSHPLTTVFLQNQLAQLQLTSAIYDGSGPRLTQSAAWKKAVNPPDTNVSTRHAWSALELWDGRRGCFEWGSEDAQALFALLPAWLKADGTPPTDANLNDFRPDLAAFTHMVFCPTGVEELQTRLESLLGDSTMGEPSRAILAAARLDLALTRISGGVAPAMALPQILDEDGLTTLLDWANLVLQSQAPWETRAGMNALILLVRLADTMDDLIIADVLGQKLPEMHKAVELIQKSVAGVLNNDAAQDSALPLAYVAADLMRYTRFIARGIVVTGLIAKPAWLPISGISDQNVATAGALIDALATHFSAAPRANLRVFAAGGLPARLLLLAVFQIKLDQYERNRRLTVKAPRPNEVLALSELRRATRELICGDAVLTHDWPADQERLPWWQARYWAGRGVQGEDVTGGDPDFVVTKKIDSLPTFQMINWLPSARTQAEGNIRMTAAVLEAAVPSMPPDVPPSLSKDENRPAVVYDASFLVDIDGRLEGELPTFAWQPSREALIESVKRLKEDEEVYSVALDKQRTTARTEQMIKWLKAPLRLSTADFQEQIEAAIAEVRQAEADLEAAQHESVAAVLEQGASELIYQAVGLELKRKEVLQTISGLDEQITASATEIGRLEEKFQKKEITQAELDKSIATKKREQANLQLQKAASAREQIVEEIKQIRSVLGDPETDPETPTGLTTGDLAAHQTTLEKIIEQLGDKLTDEQKAKLRDVRISIKGKQIVANGQLAAMAVKIEISLAKKLLEELSEARTELAAAAREERRRKRKAKRNALVKGVCKFIGAAVGAFFGGPQGAALGAEIGEAVAELGIGIAENKPPEDILMGLVDNAFAISGAAGYDLEKELNDLGAKGLAEVNALFASAEQSLGPLLDSLPKVFDEPMFTQALQAFGLDEVPQMAELAHQTFTSLKDDLGSFSKKVSAEGGLGTILKDAAHFDSAEGFRQSLSEKLLDNVFSKTVENAEQLAVLGRTLGKEVEELKTPGGQVEAAKRLSTLVVTSMSQEAVTFRNSIVSEWLKGAQAAKHTWDQVQGEADTLLDNFFPNPQAREQVAASLRSALLDPDTKRAILQGLLNGRDENGQEFGVPGGWMGELDKKTDEIMKLENQASGNRKDIAKAQIDYLTNALIRFNTTLLPFLKDDSQARDELFKQLRKLQSDLEKQQLTLEIVASEVGITTDQLEKAELNIQQQQDLLEAAGKRVKQMELGEERASLMSHVAELSKLESEKMEQAKKKSSEAVAERAKATQARVQAVQAALDARRAHLEAAQRRGAEASRIRTALNRPPLARSLNIAGAMADKARYDHATNLEHALRAYRELLRFYVSVGADEAELPERPDDLQQNDKPLTWSSALEKWLAQTGTFGVVTVVPKTGNGIEWELTPQQIKALTSPNGLRIVCRSDEDADRDKPVFRVEASLWQLFEVGGAPGEWRSLPSEWHEKFSRNHLSLTGTAQYRRFADSVTIRSQSTDVVMVKTHDEAGIFKTQWSIKQEVLYQIKRDGNELQVWEVHDRYSFYDDRIIEGIDAQDLSNGRILGVFLSIPKADSSGGYIGDLDYGIRAEHLGQVFLSDRDTRLRLKRDQKSLGDRLFLIGDQDPWSVFNERMKAVAADGDSLGLTVQGLPLGGTTVLKLLAKGSEVFTRVKLQVLYKYYKKVDHKAINPVAPDNPVV